MKKLLDRFLDTTVVGGFSAIGYRARGLDRKPIDGRLDGKRVLVTGATGGLGLAAASAMSKLGAEMLLVGRNPAKLAAAAEEMGGPVETHRADLGSMRQVADLAETVAGTVDVLVNNVGVLFPERTITTEGLEATFATNLLGQFILTNRLIEDMLPGSRIVTVSSGGMYTTPISLSDLQNERDYRGAIAYARTKRAQVVLAAEWARRRPEVISHSMHPGWADTGGVAGSLPTFYRITKPILRSPQQGADTIVYLAADPEPASTNGLFWHDRRPRPIHRTKATRLREKDPQEIWAALETAARDALDKEKST